MARALMTAAVDAAGRMGAVRLGLAVEPANGAAGRLYESLGFDRHRLEVVDIWHWSDDDGVQREQRDLCTYWTLAVEGSR